MSVSLSGVTLVRSVSPLNVTLPRPCCVHFAKPTARANGRAWHAPSIRSELAKQATNKRGVGKR